MKVDILFKWLIMMTKVKLQEVHCSKHLQKKERILL